MAATAQAPALEQFIPMARSMARVLAREQADRDDLVQEGCMALHAALQREPQPRNPQAFARAIMFRRMLETTKRERERRQVTLPFSEEELAATLAPEAEANAELDGFLSGLEAAHGRAARWAAENMIHPQATVAQFALMDAERSSERRVEDRSRRRNVDHVKITHVQIREALGLPVSRWRPLLSDIRAFAANWLEEGAT